MSGTGGDADGNEVKFPILTCQVHYDHTGGGHPPPPTVTPMRHDGDMEGLKWASHHHRSVCQGGVAEEMAAGRRGNAGDPGEGLSGLRKASQYGHLVSN